MPGSHQAAVAVEELVHDLVEPIIGLFTPSPLEANSRCSGVPHPRECVLLHPPLTLVHRINLQLLHNQALTA